MTERKKTEKKKINRASVKQLQAIQYTCNQSPRSVGKKGKYKKTSEN